MNKPRLDVQVVSRYMPEQSSAQDDVYAFTYTVTIRNTGDTAAQLIARYWHITDGAGHTEEVRGLGVVGHQPMLKPGQQFEYSSWTRIATPKGRMRGTYYCITEDAHWFETDIAPFELTLSVALH